MLPLTRGFIYRPPTPASVALADPETWFASPSLRLLAEPPRYWSVLREMVRSSGIPGPMVHDARIASICRAHEVTRLWSANRVFSRFGIAVHNPLVWGGEIAAHP